MDPALHSHNPAEGLHRFVAVGAGCMQRISGILLLDEINPSHDGQVRRHHLVGHQQPGLHILFDVVLASVLLFAIVFGPTCIKHPAIDPEHHEAHEAGTVKDRFLGVVNADHVKAQQYEDLEHQNLILARPPLGWVVSLSRVSYF